MIEVLRGNIIIENPSKEEKTAISGFMKKDYSRHKTITVNLKTFQKRLDETKFEGITIKELLEKYFGVEIIAQGKEKQQKREEFNQYLKEMVSSYNQTSAGEILKKVLEEKEEFYVSIKTKYNNEKENLKKSMHDALKCINQLQNEKEKIRLPIFASKVINNPHGLDKTNLTGRLFISLLLEMENLQNKKVHIKNSEDIAELYYRHNLLIDDVSNMVLCKNIIACKGENEHNGWKGFFENDEAMQITLDNLSKIDNVKIKGDYAIVVENPAVFMLLAEKFKSKRVPLVCTYGQVKLSGTVLLTMLSKVCSKIYYSGDSDPEGLQIADKIKSKLKESVCLVGFDVDTYYECMSDVTISEERLKKLEHIEDSNLKALAEVMKKEKRATYEEAKAMKWNGYKA